MIFAASAQVCSWPSSSLAVMQRFGGDRSKSRRRADITNLSFVTQSGPRGGHQFALQQKLGRLLDHLVSAHEQRLAGTRISIRAIINHDVYLTYVEVLNVSGDMPG